MAGGMVEGAIGLEPKQRDDAVHIFQHILCRHANDLKSLRCQACVTRGVTSRCRPAIMRLAVDFDDQSCSHAAEIRDIGTDRVLTTEFRAQFLAAQLLPQENLGQGHFAAEFAGGIDLRALQAPRAPSTTLRVVPLPVSGRILDGHHSVHPG